MVLRGEASPRSKLTEDDVRKIRRACASGETHRALAAEFGVSASAIGEIARHVQWRHVADSATPAPAESPPPPLREPEQR